MLLITALSACTTGLEDMKMTDHSFEFEPSVVYDKETTRNSLVLELARGKGKDFKGTFTIDDGNSTELLEKDGSPFEQGSSFSTDEEGRKVFLLKNIHTGEHTLNMSISNGIYTQEKSCKLKIDREPFRFNTSVVSDAAETSVLMLTLSEGFKKTKYTGTVILDKEVPVTGEEPIEMDFSKNAMWSLALPYMRPGEHSLDITVNDGKQEESTTYTFTEPFKHKTVLIRLYNDMEGRYHLDIPFNPYKINIKGNSLLDIRAECTYCYDAPHTKTTVKTINDKKEFDLYEQSIDIVMTQRDSMVHKVRNMYENSETWKRVPVGGQIDPGSEVVVTGSQRIYYKIRKEEFYIDLEHEEMPGVKVEIENNIGRIFFNGKEMDLGKFDYYKKEKNNVDSY